MGGVKTVPLPLGPHVSAGLMSGLSGCGHNLQVLSGIWAQSTQKEENLQIKPKSKTFIIFILLCYLYDYNPVFKINIHESILI